MSQLYGHRENEVLVSASGEVHAPYELARFGVTISDVAATGAKAKTSIKAAVDAATGYVDRLISAGRARRKVVSLSVDPHYVFEQSVNRLRGYRASASVRFESSDVAHVLEIQEALTELQQSHVASVSYGFQDPESLRELALEQAWAAVLRRWAHQARVLGVDPAHFRVGSWAVDYAERAPTMKVSAPAGEEAPGIAAVRVSLTAYFVRSGA